MMKKVNKEVSKMLGGLKDPRKYGKKVRKLSQADYKPWLISKRLPAAASFTIDRDFKKREVVIWSRFPEYVEQAIKKS